MVGTVPDVLAQIVAHKQAHKAAAGLNLRDLRRRAERRISERRNFRQALLANPPAIIAEFKKGSPSKGLFAAQADPSLVAEAYEAGGAAAVSILTDREFFHGSLDDLEVARNSCRIPLLRKDFTLDEADVLESAARGADAILLIVAILSVPRMRELLSLAGEYALDCLIEVHDKQELNEALQAGAKIVGVNNRDLRTFEVKLENSLRLAEHIPEGVVRVAESGIRTSSDMITLSAVGYHAFLVGEHLMTAPDPAAAVRVLRA